MSAPIDVAARSALQLAAMLGAGLADAQEVAERTLAAVRECEDPAIFTCLTEARARSEAEAAARRHREGRPRGLLDGVPVAWKDLFDLAGLITTAGSHALDDMPPATADAPVVARLAQAGMVSVGRTNMTEFAYSGIGLNPNFGTPRNPHGPGAPRVPGGSSSGSAVAVARGLVAVAIGSDTGGSVRIPAAFNGIVGYKSSTGRYPTEGAYPLSRTLDTVGVFTRTVADAVLVDAALRGLAAPSLAARPLAGQLIVVPSNVVFDDAEAAVMRNFEAALERLEAAGAAVDRRRLAVFDEILALSAERGAIAAAEAYAQLHFHVEGKRGAQIDRRVAARIRAGGKIRLEDYVFALHERRRMIAALVAAHAPGTLFAFPTVPHVAPRIDELEADDALFARVNMRTLRNTMLGNFLDWCGVSVPSGADAEGLPTGLLLSGLPGADDDLLGIALSVEAALRG
jgi:aspartyl-tRNA(Asn)/glutamyl-tRNA(Gln) amidotransferase subunit A